MEFADERTGGGETLEERLTPAFPPPVDNEAAGAVMAPVKGGESEPALRLRGSSWGTRPCGEPAAGKAAAPGLSAAYAAVGPGIDWVRVGSRGSRHHPVQFVV